MELHLLQELNNEIMITESTLFDLHKKTGKLSADDLWKFINGYSVFRDYVYGPYIMINLIKLQKAHKADIRISAHSLVDTALKLYTSHGNDLLKPNELIDGKELNKVIDMLGDKIAKDVKQNSKINVDTLNTDMR